jgi:hypothetical protein
MNIEIRKFYITRDGHKVRIYALDGASDYPIHGAYLCEEEGWLEECWDFQGCFSNNDDAQDLDIVNKWSDSPMIFEGNIKPEPLVYSQLPNPESYPDDSMDAISYALAGIDFSKGSVLTPRKGWSVIEDKNIPDSNTIYSIDKSTYHLWQGHTSPQIKMSTIAECTAALKNALIDGEGYIQIKTTNDCECGSSSIGCASHSSWCPANEVKP